MNFAAREPFQGGNLKGEARIPRSDALFRFDSRTPRVNFVE
jgi:hypothetical protein